MMVWLPRARVDVTKVATPAAFSVPVPMVVAPSRKVTVPVGAGPEVLAGLTVAVKVTLWPTADGFTLEARVIAVVVSGVMTSRTMLDKATSKFWVPL